MAPVIEINVGGTFTDAFATDGSGRVTGMKTPSIPPDFSRASATALDELAVTLGTDSRCQPSGSPCITPSGDRKSLTRPTGGPGPHESP